MSDDFLLQEGETIEFEEDGWLVQVGEVDFESRTVSSLLSVCFTL